MKFFNVLVKRVYIKKIIHKYTIISNNILVCIFLCLYKKWDQTFAAYSLKAYIGQLSISLNINQLLHFQGSTALHS